MTVVIPETARAMRLRSPNSRLLAEDVRLAAPGEYDLLLDVAACGVCRTDLHLLDGELPQAHYPITPGHEIVGRVRARGTAVTRFAIGDRVEIGRAHV